MSKSLIAHGFSEDLSQVTQLFLVSSQNKKKVDMEAAEIIESIRNLLLQDYQRKTIDGSLGRWFCIKKPRATYFALAGQGYPERLAYQLLNVA